MRRPSARHPGTAAVGLLRCETPHGLLPYVPASGRSRKGRLSPWRHWSRWLWLSRPATTGGSSPLAHTAKVSPAPLTRESTPTMSKVSSPLNPRFAVGAPSVNSQRQHPHPDDVGTMDALVALCQYGPYPRGREADRSRSAPSHLQRALRAEAVRVAVEGQCILLGHGSSRRLVCSSGARNEAVMTRIARACSPRRCQCARRARRGRRPPCGRVPWWPLRSRGS